MSLIFISHSSKDNDKAIALKNWLVKNGWDDLFLDTDSNRGITSGEKWQNALRENSGKCDAVLFLISKNWLEPDEGKEDWCIKEFRFAKILNKQLFPLLLDNLTVEDIPEEIKEGTHLTYLELGTRYQSPKEVVLPDGTKTSIAFSEDGLKMLKNGLNKAGLNPSSFAWPPENDPKRPPYRGLLPLEAKDAGIFFGRDGSIFSLMAQIRGLRELAPPRFMVILGASGSGKSSFMRAGILPRLKRKEQHFSVFPIIRPKQAVISGSNGFLQSLNEQCKYYNLNYTRKSLEAAISSGEQALLSIFKEISEKVSIQFDKQNYKAPTLLLAIDQAEELFLSEGKLETKTFLKLLSYLSLSREINLMILCTIRSDDYRDLQTAKELEGISQQTFSLPPIVKGAYQQIIEGPAKLLEKTNRPLAIDPRLTERLLKDLEEDDSKDALPLLAFTLERLYIDYGDDGNLRLEEYLTFEKNIGGIKQTLGLGGLSGVVEMAVENALNEAQKDPKIPTDKTECLRLLRRGLIPWLAGIDLQTNSPRRRVARYDEIPIEARALIEYLVKFRLLSKDVNKNNIITIEPAHESILRQWQQLNGWLKEDMAELSALETLKSATRDWEANNRNNEWLSHRGSRLQDAENLLKEDFSKIINDSQHDYLTACRADEDKQRDIELKKAQTLAKAQQEALKKQKQVTRRTLVGLVVSFILLLFAIGAMFWAFDKQKEANWQRKEAEKQTKIAKENAKQADKETQKQKKQKERFIKLLIASTEKNIDYLAIRGKLFELSETDLVKKDKITSVIAQFNKIIGKEAIPNYKVKNSAIYYKEKIFKTSADAIKEIEKKYPGFINLILETESMDDDERQYWFYIISVMTQEQIIKFYKILDVERAQLEELEEEYKGEIKTLNEEHLIEWNELQIKELNKKSKGKRIDPIDAEEYLKSYIFLLNSKTLNKNYVLEKLIDVEKRLNLSEITNFKTFISYKQLLEKIISLSPNEKKSIYQEKLWKFYQAIYEKGYVSKEEVGDKAIDLSQTLLNNHEYSVAVNILEKTIQFIPNNFILKKNLAIAYLLQGNKTKAIKIFQNNLDKHILYNKKTILWQELFFYDIQNIQKFKITNLLDPDILSKINFKISKFLLSSNEYEILSSAIKSLVEKKNAFSSVEMLKALQVKSEKIRNSKNFYTKDMFELYEKVYWEINKLIGDEKKLELAKKFMSISKDMRANGVISQYKFASNMLSVTWYLLFTKNKKDLENAVALSKKAKQIAPDFLVINTNYAHALALLGKENEALKIYKDNLGKMIFWSNGKEDNSWEDAILRDFEDLEKKGIHSSTFDKVKKLIKKYKSKQSKITDIK